LRRYNEVATLSSERSKLMNMLDSSEPEEVADPAAEEAGAFTRSLQSST
jgi:hypothetical protein